MGSHSLGNKQIMKNKEAAWYNREMLYRATSSFSV